MWALRMWERDSVLEEQVKHLLHYHGDGEVLELVRPGHDLPQNMSGNLNTGPAGDVSRSSFGMVVRPNMTQ